MIIAALKNKKRMHAQWQRLRERMGERAQEMKHLRHKMRKVNSRVRNAIRQTRSDFWIDRSAQIQNFFDAKNVREYFREVNRTFGGTMKSSVNNCGWINGLITQRLRKLDGTLTNTDEETLHRFAEHFQELFNQPGESGAEVDQYLPVWKFQFQTQRSRE